ncbi:GntR family transcriptional regulator [Inquilinus limosus]|uniref:GntR family transcriptional regulator n=1 Tax=Inquilinus limosus TaxID=171674 RepID=UPI003F1580E8
MAGDHEAARREACYARLKEMAVHCRFRPGEHLKIGRLCERLRASSTPVREALIQLHAESLVTATAREGFFARVPNAEEFSDLYRLARSLLVEAIRTPAAGRDRGRAAAILDWPRAPTPAAEAWAAMERLMIELSRLSGNREISRIIGNVNDRIRCIRMIASLDAELVRGMVTDGRQIADALAVGDAQAATLILETMFDRDIRRLPDLTKELLARAHSGGFD